MAKISSNQYFKQTIQPLLPAASPKPAALSTITKSNTERICRATVHAEQKLETLILEICLRNH